MIMFTILEIKVNELVVLTTLTGFAIWRRRYLSWNLMAKLSRESRITSARPKSAVCKANWRKRRRGYGFFLICTDMQEKGMARLHESPCSQVFGGGIHAT